MSFAVKLEGNPIWYSSDLGIGYYKIERRGYLRTTLRLPPGTKLDLIERIAVRCDVAGNPKSGEEIKKLVNAGCDLKAVNKIFMLDEHFQPGPSLPVRFSNQQLKLRFGEMVGLYDAGGTH